MLVCVVGDFEEVARLLVCVVEDFDKWEGCEARSQRLTAAIMTISPETSALTMHI